MAKIVSRLIVNNSNSNSKFVAKNLVSSCRVLQHSNIAASNSNSNSNSNFSTPTNILFLYTYNNEDYRSVTQVSKLRYPINTVTVTVTDDDDDDLLYYSGFLRICSHSHGIVCLSDCHKYIILFNPFTRLLLTLRPPPLLPSHIFRFLPRVSDLDRCYHENGVGLRYYPDSNHFKVVRFVSYKGRGGLHNILAHVYNSITGNWRQIFSTPVIGPFPYFSGKDVLHNGVHYWLTYTEDREFIQSFDIDREVFNPLVPISNTTYKALDIRELYIWNGSIVLLTFGKDRDIFHIWGIDKDDDESGVVSLSELFTLGPHSGLWDPLLFVNSDELLMANSDRKVACYNLKTQEIKYLPVKADYISLFENSLVSFQGGIIP